MSSFIPSTIQDKINALITQITNVYKAFIQHTKTFFIDSTGNTTITSNEDINLNSGSGNLNINSDNINISSNNSVSITSNNNLSIGTANSTSNNDLSIVSSGSFFIGSDNNSINLINLQNDSQSTGQLAILWGNDIPTMDTYSIGTLYICTNGNLYIYTNTESPEWKQITISN